MDYKEEDIELFRKLAEGEVLRDPLPKDRARLIYKPLFKHPLENIEARYHHEKLLHRILVCPYEKQVSAAITMNDAWCLEECYIRGAIVDNIDKGGITPLHLAARLDRLECA